MNAIRTSPNACRRAAIAAFATAVLIGACAAPAPPAALPAELAGLPTGERWRQHLDAELLPFWMHEAALGEPLGNFPSTRCNDGSALDRAKPCPEVGKNGWLMMDRNYVVSMSRQTYGYGVAFHMTGDKRYLDYAKAGVDYLRKHAFDRGAGGTYAYWDGDANAWGPEPEFRNPQELAYALLGPSFYYYLTRDEEVLEDIVSAKEYILSRYYNPELNALQWMLKSNDEADALDRRLVAQLDQLNAYMVLMAPVLPEAERAKWLDDMVKLARIMIDEFYSPEENLFFLTVNSPEDLSTQNARTDFGHTIKAMWMIRFVGLLANQPDLVAFAEANGPKVLERAFLADSGAWALAVNKGGAIDHDKDWWTYAELNQYAGTAALIDVAQARYLPATTDYYFQHFVDPVNGEVWTSLDGDTNLPHDDLPKAWPWKSAYHSFEHALVGYITAQQLRGLPARLYFAFGRTPDATTIRPYFFQGDLRGLDVQSDDGRTTYAADFANIR